MEIVKEQGRRRLHIAVRLALMSITAPNVNRRVHPIVLVTVLQGLRLIHRAGIASEQDTPM